MKQDCLLRWRSAHDPGRLIVERGSFRDQSEDWGDYDSLGLPSPGDRVTVDRDNTVNYLTVLCVHHQPVTERERSAATPTAHVVAKWTGPRY